MAEVEFVKYTGTAPDLCKGALYVKIDGKMISFNAWSDSKKIPDFPGFWESGGEVEYGEDGLAKDAIQAPWKLIKDADCYLPDWIKCELPELLRVFNEHVPWGCCGGCIFKPIVIKI